MKAISILQPWAWLIVNGHKDIENRNWPTKVRGLVAIHAGKGFDHEGYQWVRQNFPHIPLPAEHEFQRGGVVGQGHIVDCVARSASPWFFGEYGFVFEQARPCQFIPLRGALGFFEVRA